MKTSPFATHRDKVLGGYGAAGFLFDVVLTMYNGRDYRVNLSRLTGLDSTHREALLEMIEWYAMHGENDDEFIALARTCVARIRASYAE